MNVTSVIRMNPSRRIADGRDKDAPVPRENRDDHNRNRSRSHNYSREVEATFADLGIKTFKQEYRRLLKLAEAEDFSSNRAAYALLRSQFSMLINTLPIVEEAMHHYRTDRSAYSMVAVSNHLREIAHDLRTFGDQTELVERVRKDIIQAMLSSLATAIIADISKVRQKLYEKLPEKSGKFVAAELKEYQTRLADIFTDADNNAYDVLQRVLVMR